MLYITYIIQYNAVSHEYVMCVNSDKFKVKLIQLISGCLKTKINITVSVNSYLAVFVNVHFYILTLKVANDYIG